MRDERGKESNEWGEFLHTGEKKFISYEEICQEIIDETERATGGNNNIISTPIRLKLFSPTMVPLTLVDLPGIVKNAQPGQDPKIVV